MPANLPADSKIIESLAAICGEARVAAGDDIPEKYLRDFLDSRRGRARALAKPESTEQVSQIVKLCAANRIPVVPHGGNTGYRAGAAPDESGRAIVLSMERMNAAPRINAAAGFMTAQAGCILENLQNAAEEAGMFFPLNLGSKGSCQIGGNLATNAGGLNFLRYGGARELCLGLEAVLPNGEIANLMSAARKRNEGYDIKNLLIGSEGSLGIITAAALKLHPAPARRACAFAAANGMEDALELLRRCQRAADGRLESFEIIPRSLWRLLLKHFPEETPPLKEPPPLAVLLESAAADSSAEDQMQGALEQAMEDGVIFDAVLPASESQRRQFWRWRELTPEATRREGRWLKLDVCLPLDGIAAFASAAARLVGDREKISPGADSPHIIEFGHLGDGNLHLSIRPNGGPPDQNPQLASEIKAALLDLVRDMGGAFSAEHGIGRTSASLLQQYASPAAFQAMRAVKSALDPGNIMNPGAVLESALGAEAKTVTEGTNPKAPCRH